MADRPPFGFGPPGRPGDDDPKPPGGGEGPSGPIGPFGFGGSYNRSSSDVKFDDASRSFTAQDTTEVPQVVAIICSVLPNFE